MPSTPKETLSVPPKPPARSAETAARPKEIGGPQGPEPTRYGDWENNGRCTDF
ncbi:MAG: DUF1674 domain-containing protein [Dongiaceae bacterium]